MKRIVSMACCGIIMLSDTLAWANASNTYDDEVMNFYKLSDAIVYDDFYWPADSGGKVAPRRKIQPSRIRRDFFAQPSKWSASWVI